jgi:hypothetical protein
MVTNWLNDTKKLLKEKFGESTEKIKEKQRMEALTEIIKEHIYDRS